MRRRSVRQLRARGAGGPPPARRPGGGLEPGFVLGGGAQAVGVQPVVEEARFEHFFEAAQLGADRAGQESGEADLDQGLIRVLRLFHESANPCEVPFPADFLFEGEPGEGSCPDGGDRRWGAGLGDLHDEDLPAVALAETGGLVGAGVGDAGRPGRVLVGGCRVPVAEGQVVQAGAGGGVPGDGVIGRHLGHALHGAVGKPDPEPSVRVASIQAVGSFRECFSRTGQG